MKQLYFTVKPIYADTDYIPDIVCLSTEDGDLEAFEVYDVWEALCRKRDNEKPIDVDVYDFLDEQDAMLNRLAEELECDWCYINHNEITYDDGKWWKM